MYLWRKLATPAWWAANEEALRLDAGAALAVIEQAGRKLPCLEAASESRRTAERLARRYGGRVEQLPLDWLERYRREQRGTPLRIGTRLVITNSEGSSGNGRSRNGRRHRLFIPAGAAFGTGQHATTSMSLRFLEEITRGWKRGWSMVDLGTGSGILALAALRLGAGNALGIDVDPVAISTARANARQNKIQGVKFQAGDVRRWRLQGVADVIVANLFSELLIEILSKLKRARWLVLSGVLREQEIELFQALSRSGFESVKVRRRGRWIAVLARPLGEEK